MSLFSRIHGWFNSEPNTKSVLIESAWKHIETIGVRDLNIVSSFRNDNVYTHMDRSNDISIRVNNHVMKDSHEYRLEIHIKAYKVR